MVENLQNRDYETIVWGRNKDAVAAVVESLVYGDEGILPGIREGSVLIDFGTSIPASTHKIEADLAKKGVGMIGAPLGRTPANAGMGNDNVPDIFDYFLKIEK